MIDGGVFLGRNPANGNTLSVKALLADMVEHKIEKAVIASYKSLYFNYKEGNEEILSCSRKYGNLIPAAIINPMGFDAKNDLPYLWSLKKKGFKIINSLVEA